jgi:hypothetical protein
MVSASVRSRTRSPDTAASRSATLASAHPDDSFRIEAVKRLVQHQDQRISEHRGRDAEALPHPQRVTARLAFRYAPQAGLLNHLVNPAGGQALRAGKPAQVVAG